MAFIITSTHADSAEQYFRVGGCSRFSPIVLRGLQWKEVGAGLEDCGVSVGALNCDKYLSLCRSINVRSYPTVLAFNWPDAPPATEDLPATKTLDKSRDTKDIMQQVREIFGAELTAGGEKDVEEHTVERGLDTEQEGNGGGGGKNAAVGLGGGGGSGGEPNTGASCGLRVEDAVVSVRYALRNDVFIQGETLPKERLGEEVHGCCGWRKVEEGRGGAEY